MRTLLILGLTVAAASASAQIPATSSIEPLSTPAAGLRSEVVLEVGLAVPTGDLKDDFDTTPLGFGTGDGFELGFRWRLHLGDHVSVAPSFHFTDYDDLDGFHYIEKSGNLELAPAVAKTSVYSYKLQIRYTLRPPESFWSPFATVSAGLDRNRLHGWRKEYSEPVDVSVNTLGLGAGLGVRVDRFELGAVYRYDSFSSSRYFKADVSPDYDWSALVVRAGWILGL